jgi:hypothetical protein
MPAPGKWAVDAHPKRAEILAAMANGARDIDIHRNITPDISARTISKYRKAVFRPAVTIALQVARNKPLSEMTEKPRDVLAQVSAADPILATMRAEAAQRNGWIGAAETDPEHGGTANHQALYSHDRNRLQQHRLHAELVGALTKETAGPTTNIMIINASPDQAKVPTEVLDAEIVDAGE